MNPVFVREQGDNSTLTNEAFGNLLISASKDQRLMKIIVSEAN